jgi:hypothetical protein
MSRGSVATTAAPLRWFLGHDRSVHHWPDILQCAPVDRVSCGLWMAGIRRSAWYK